MERYILSGKIKDIKSKIVGNKEMLSCKVDHYFINYNNEVKILTRNVLVSNAYLAKRMKDYLKDGDEVLLEGEVNTSIYNTNGEIKASVSMVNVNYFEKLNRINEYQMNQAQANQDMENMFDNNKEWELDL